MPRKDWVRLTKQERVVLKSRMRTAGSAAERRRLNVVSLYDAGRKMAWIAATLGCSVATVSLDVQRWRTGRFAGLVSQPCGGSTPKLSEEQWAALEQALEAPPCAVGYRAGTWTLPLMVRFLVEQVRAPKLHIGNVSRALAKRGWERRRPRLGIVREDPQRDEKLAAIEVAKRGRWQRTRRP